MLGYVLILVAIFFTCENSTTVDVEGWQVSIGTELESDPKTKQATLVALANHLQRIKFIVSKNRVNELQKLPIKLDLDHKLRRMQYHPSSGWLEKNGFDPGLAKHVHIPKAEALLDRSQWAQHPYVILHELAHAFHDQVLGFSNEEILSAFEHAKKTKLYDRVLNHVGQKVRHYAMQNEKEFFAEMTEAYFGVNDFFPFVRAEIKVHDPKTYSMLVKIWGPIRGGD